MRNQWFFKISIWIVMLASLALSAKAVLARDPVPPLNPANPAGQRVKYYPQVFVPAINSQDVNLQSTVYEIYLSLLSSIFASTFKCDQDCNMAIMNPPVGDTGNGTYMANKPEGLIPWLVSANTSMLSKAPVSSVEYIAYVGNKLHLVQPAYAQTGQGFGYEGLAPARKLWVAFRNIAYMVATIGFVFLAFMVMFRIKISSQTVIGAQQAITKLIIVFLTITFSYAVAGLIVDLVFLFSFVIIGLFVNQNLVTGLTAQQLQAQLFTGNIFHQLSGYLTFTDQAGIVLNNLVVDTLTPVLQGMGGFGDNIARFIGGGFDLVGQIIIGIAIIYSMFKLLFQLLMTILEIMVLTILAPILILPDILPGGGAFMSWARRLFANAMVFPTVTFMILLGRSLVGVWFDTSGNVITSGAGSPWQSGLQFPYVGVAANAVTPLLGVAMILLIPKAVDMVKNALKVSAFQYSTAVGAALGYGAGAVGGATDWAVGRPARGARRLAGEGARAGVRYGMTEQEAIWGVTHPGRAGVLRSVREYGERRRWW